MYRQKGTGEEGAIKNSYILGISKGKPENFLGEGRKCVWNMAGRSQFWR